MKIRKLIDKFFNKLGYIKYDSYLFAPVVIKYQKAEIVTLKSDLAINKDFIQGLHPETVETYIKDKHVKELTDKLKHYIKFIGQEDGPNCPMLTSTAIITIIDKRKYI